MSTAQESAVFALPSFIQVIVVGDVLNKKYEGREYTTQQLECIALDADGKPLQVGVLAVPKDKQGLLTTGIYRPVFGMRVDRERRIVPAIIDLLADKPAPGRAAAPAALKVQ